jgi:hypothetical protein
MSIKTVRQNKENKKAMMKKSMKKDIEDNSKEDL